MEMPKPGPQHAILARMAGTWNGEEKMHASPFTPEGQESTGRITASMGLDGFYLMSDYTQSCGDQVKFRGHGVFGWDMHQERLTMHWFDSMGMDPGAPATGVFENETIVFKNQNPMGHGRFTYTFESDDRYTFCMEFSPDGEQWMPMMDAIYTRE